MATHQIYIGGPGRVDASRHQFPAVDFNANGSAFKAMDPAVHKGPVQFALTRVLDFGYSDGTANDPALRDYVQRSTIASGDVLNLQVIPANTLMYGVHIAVERPGVAGTLQLKVGANFYGSTVDLTTESSMFAPATTAATAGVTEGTVDLSKATFSNVPQMLAGTLTLTGGEDDLKGLRIAISPLLSACKQGQF